MIAVAAVCGAAFGSFLNVVCFRLPRGESLVRPRSRCPACGHPIRPWDNVPILSYLLLRGRCRDCGASIPLRYPLLEALTAALVVAVVATKHGAAAVALGVVLVVVVVPAAAIDLSDRIVPNRLTGAGAACALTLGTILDPAGEPVRLLSAVVAGGALAALSLAYPRGMGMGDAKLTAVLGLLLGPFVGVAFAVAVLSGLVGGVAVALRSGAARVGKVAIPFAVFLAFGAVCALFFGHPLVHLYSHLVLAR